MSATTSSREAEVRHFRQILLWPVQLVPSEDGNGIPDYAAQLLASGPESPWHEVQDEFTGDPGEFHERHYNEFVAFLPPVQRFLYGQGLGKSVRQGYGESPIRVLRRDDIARIRVQLTADAPALSLEIAHVDLYFFFDIDVAVLALECHADGLDMPTVHDLMFRLGRAYPAFWEDDGRAGNCPHRMEFLAADGSVLSTSDYENRIRYLSFACEHRAPCVASHWQFLLRPLVLHHSNERGTMRYRQLEYHRMPQMAYVALAGEGEPARADAIRLALASGAAGGERFPLAESHFATFEAQYRYDRFPEIRDGGRSTPIRYWCSGDCFVVTGSADSMFFAHLERGYLARFRHQHFLLFLIAHFHKASLQMFSDRLAAAVGGFDVTDASAVVAFRRQTRRALETFLRFTHRYWFHEISHQAQTRDLFEMCRRHLGIDRLYDDIRREVQDMSQYLESEAMRRQNDTIMRLTVVTTFGLIGTVVTGFLGMNLFSLADEPAWTKLLVFLAVLVPATLLILYTVKRSRRLSAFLDAVSSDKTNLAAMRRAPGGPKSARKSIGWFGLGRPADKSGNR